MIKLTAIGHLGKDATTSNANGKNVINFSVAHTEKYTSNGRQVEKTIWLECAYWTEKTAIVPYLKKGTQVYIEGQPEVRMWESNGKHGASLTVRIFSVQLLGSKEQQAPPAAQQPASNAQPAYANQPDPNANDDMPF